MAELSLRLKGYKDSIYGTIQINNVITKTGTFGHLAQILPNGTVDTLDFVVASTVAVISGEVGGTSTKTIAGDPGDTGIRVAKSGLMSILSIPSGTTAYMKFSGIENIPVYNIGA